MSEIIGNTVIACADCFASGVDAVTRFVWWRNGYGSRIRVFCHKCGAVYDKVEKNGIVESHKVGMKAAIWKKYQDKDMRTS